MRKSVAELNCIPNEFHEGSAPELPPLPDEFNRFTPPMKDDTKDRRKGLRKMLMILAAVGVILFGGVSAKQQDAEQPVSEAELPAAPTPFAEQEKPPASVSPTATPAVQETPAPTPEPTPEPTTEPTSEPTPEPTPEPVPDVEPIFIRSSQVYYAALDITVPENISDVTFRFRDPITGAVAVETQLTPEEIAEGTYASERFDANGFLYEQMQSYPEPVDEPELVMETTFTFRTDEGVQTVTAESAPEAIPWVGVNFDAEEDVGGILEMMYGTVYPDCFVVRIEEAPRYDLPVMFGDDPDALEAGGVLITITVDGKLLTGEYEPTAFYRSFIDGVVSFYVVYAVPRPADFPEHGTAHVEIRQRLTQTDYLFEKKPYRDIQY